MRVVAEAVQQVLHVLVHQRVVRDVVDPRLVLLRRRQIAVEQQEGRLQVGAVLGQQLDG
jgi:hypothetical protein